MKKLALLFFVAVVAFAQVPTISSSSSTVQEGQTATITCTANCTGLTWQVNGVNGGNSTIGTISGNNSSATYTAPASIVAQNSNQASGCQIYPNDSVWNTQASTLPYISNWHGDPLLNDSYFIGWLASKAFQHLSVTYGIGDSIVTNSTPSYPIEAHYANYKDIIQIPTLPSLMRESGAYDAGANDHHTSILNKDDCNFAELYNEGPVPYQCTGDPAGTKNCYLASSTVRPGSINNRYTWGGGTDAANEPLTPYLIHLSEIRKGVINHAMRFDLVSGYAPNGQTSPNGQNIVWPANGATGGCSPGIVGLTISNGGSGYSAGTTITFVGGYDTKPGDGGSLATATLTISGGVITGYTITSNGSAYYNNPASVTVQLNNVGSGSGAVITPIVDWPCPPYGARYVLDPAYFAAHNGVGCSAGTKCLTGAAQIVAQALVNYGMMMNDNTCCGIFSMYASRDITEDHSIWSQINSGSSGLATLSISDFHIVDESGLCNNCSLRQNSEVLPNNTAGVVPNGVIWITATNASGTSAVANIIAQAPAIGTPDAEINILAGDYSGSKGTGGGYQIPFWVNNTSATAVTWTCSTCASNGSSITSGGIYTPPLSESTAGLQDILTATLNADSTCTAIVYVNILPNAGNYVANTIRMDIGNTSDLGPDGNNNYWVRDEGGSTGDRSGGTATWTYYKALSGGSERAVYDTSVGSPDDMQYKYIVPNGTYSVRIMSGWDVISGGGTPKISSKQWNHMPLEVQSTDAGQPFNPVLHWNMMAGAAFPYANDSNSDFIFISKVTDNTLPVTLTSGAIQGNWPLCGAWSNETTGCFCQPTLSGIDIEPYAGTPTWNIETTNGVPTSAVSDYLDNPTTLAPGGNLTLYVQDQGSGLTGSDAVWTIVSGPGTLSTTTQALSVPSQPTVEVYTAPSSTPAKNQTVIIKATSQSNPSISGTITLNIVAAGATPAFFK